MSFCAQSSERYVVLDCFVGAYLSLAEKLSECISFRHALEFLLMSHTVLGDVFRIFEAGVLYWLG